MEWRWLVDGNKNDHRRRKAHFSHWFINDICWTAPSCSEPIRRPRAARHNYLNARKLSRSTSKQTKANGGGVEGGQEQQRNHSNLGLRRLSVESSLGSEVHLLVCASSFSSGSESSARMLAKMIHYDNETLSPTSFGFDSNCAPKHRIIVLGWAEAAEVEESAIHGERKSNGGGRTRMPETEQRTTEKNVNDGREKKMTKINRFRH